MKVFILIFTALFLLAVGYGLGYKKGGEDFAFLDHMLMGKLASSEELRCEKDNNPAECYKWNLVNSIGHSLVFYTQYHDKLSPLAAYVFPDHYKEYDSSIDYLKTLMLRNGGETTCEYVRELGSEQFNNCISEANEFIRQVEAGSNK